MGWGRSRNQSGVARDLIREAERMLEGRTLESYIARRERVPAWSLIALLAHATRPDLMRLATPVAAPDPAGWSGTVARLAGDLITMTRDEVSVVGLQRRSLIPLELDLLGGRTAPPCSPTEMYEMVTGALSLPRSPEF